MVAKSCSLRPHFFSLSFFMPVFYYSSKCNDRSYRFPSTSQETSTPFRGIGYWKRRRMRGERPPGPHKSKLRKKWPRCIFCSSPACLTWGLSEARACTQHPDRLSTDGRGRGHLCPQNDRLLLLLPWWWWWWLTIPPLTAKRPRDREKGEEEEEEL